MGATMAARSLSLGLRRESTSPSKYALQEEAEKGRKRQKKAA
jgi:hypothetical protein